MSRLPPAWLWIESDNVKPEVSGHCMHCGAEYGTYVLNSRWGDVVARYSGHRERQAHIACIMLREIVNGGRL